MISMTIEFLTIKDHIQVRGSKVPESIERTFRCIPSTLLRVSLYVIVNNSGDKCLIGISHVTCILIRGVDHLSAFCERIRNFSDVLAADRHLSSDHRRL